MFKAVNLKSFLSGNDEHTYITKPFQSNGNLYLRKCKQSTGMISRGLRRAETPC